MKSIATFKSLPWALKYSIFTLALCFSLSGIAQKTCSFSDDLSTATGWMQVGSQVQVANGQVEYNSAACGQQRRVYKNIGLSLDHNDNFTAEWTFRPNSAGTIGGNPNCDAYTLALTAGTGEPYSNCLNVACTGYPNSVQDGIFVNFRSFNPADGHLYFRIVARDSLAEYNSSHLRYVGLNKNYYMRLERAQDTLLELSVYLDSARTTQMTGSPISLVIPASIDGLNTAQFGMVAKGWSARSLTGSVDNICISAAPDLIPPVAKAKPDTVYLDTAGNAKAIAQNLDNGSTDNVGITSWTLNDSLFQCADRGINPVVFTVADSAGNTDTAHTYVVVLDTVRPEAKARNHSIFLDSNGLASLTVADINDNSFDNCAIAQLYVDKTNYDCTDMGQFLITLTAVDSSGNRDSVQSVVVIEDNIVPIARAKADTFYLDSTGNVIVNPADLDDGSWDNCNSMLFSLSRTQFNCSDIGTHTVLFTAADYGGRYDTTNTRITVLDTTPPTATTKTDTVYLNASGVATIIPGLLIASVADGCGISRVTANQTQFGCADLGVKHFTIFVEDSSGNQASIPAAVVVFDTITPTITCKADTAVCQNRLDGYRAGEYLPRVSDNCTNWNVQLTSGVAVGGILPVGTTTNTYTVRDSSGNSASCSMNIRVNAAPAFDFGPDTSICSQETILLQSGHNSFTNPHTWQDGSKGSTFTVTGPGLYWLEVHDVGCSYRDSLVVTQTEICMGIAEASGFGSLKVFPNPTQGTFRIQADAVQGRVELNIYSTLGKQVYRESWSTSNHQLDKEVILNQAPGTYLVILRDDQSLSQFRVTVIE
ncbi:HYR domain-containing protein [bacterium SCSIO 12741]|nr:HYR domain-containing protein [bacterium SCSIO 12741]